MNVVLHNNNGWEDDTYRRSFSFLFFFISSVFEHTNITLKMSSPTHRNMMEVTSGKLMPGGGLGAAGTAYRCLSLPLGPGTLPSPPNSSSSPTINLHHHHHHHHCWVWRSIRNPCPHPPLQPFRLDLHWKEPPQMETAPSYHRHVHTTFQMFSPPSLSRELNSLLFILRAKERESGTQVFCSSWIYLNLIILFFVLLTFSYLFAFSLEWQQWLPPSPAPSLSRILCTSLPPRPPFL